MAVPAIRGTGLKPLAITSFSLAGAEALFSLIGFAWTLIAGLSLMGGPVFLPTGNLLGAVGSLLGLAAFIVFLFFGRSVAGQVRDKGLRGTLITVLIVFCVYYLLCIIAICGLYLGAVGTIFSAATSSNVQGATSKLGTFGVIAIVLGGLMFIVYLGMEVWYIFVLQRLRDDVQRHLSKLQRES
jgi:hypothetical protein